MKDLPAAEASEVATAIGLAVDIGTGTAFNLLTIEWGVRGESDTVFSSSESNGSLEVITGVGTEGTIGPE